VVVLWYCTISPICSHPFPLFVDLTLLFHLTLAIREAIKASSTVNECEPHVVPLQQSFISIYVLLHHFAILGLLIMTVYIFENHPPFQTMERQDFDEDSFVFLIIICIAVGVSTWKKNDGFMRTKYVQGSVDGCDDGSVASSVGSSYASSVGSSYATSSAISNASSLASNTSKLTNGTFEDINMQQEKTAKRRGASDSSIGSNELVSLLERDFSAKSVSSKGDDASSIMASSVSTGGDSGDDDMDDGLLEDIITSDNESQRMDTQELFDYHMVGVPTISPDPDNDVLNIHQSLELKGVLTLCFLIYQSANASRAHENQHHGDGRDESDQRQVFNQFYNLSKVAVTAFLFLTGFGHAMYFHQQDDYSVRRVLKVLFRINFAALFLCLALDKPYIFYKPCAIHSYFFCLVYWTMRWRRGKNYTKFGLRLKMAVTALSVYLVWDCTLGLWPIHAILFGRSQHAIAGAPYGQLWEFYFQGHLHHWAALVGMLFAANHGVTSLTMRRLEKLGNPTEFIFKGIIGCAISVAMLLWTLGPFHTTKYMYNATNAYFGFLPVLWYIFIRNATASMRSHHCEIFKTLGSHSLEIYLLHNHIFLSDESGSKVMIIPGYPACNLIVILGLLILASKTLKSVTSVLISMFTEKSSDKDAIWNTVALCGCLIILHAVSVTLNFMNMSNPQMVATATIICGILLYQAIMDITMARERNMGLPKHGLKHTRNKYSTLTKDPSISRGVPPVVGTISIIFLCLVWHMASTRGALTPLPPICGDIANHGAWVKVNACSEFQKGINGREYHSKSEKSCEDAYQWGWTENKHSSRCRFRFHKPIDSQSKLNKKNVIFIGDSVTRSLYFAFCRSLGDVTAGNFDSELPLHSEITKRFGETSITFQWAPLTNDVLDKLKAIKPETDLVVAGSGALDKLHLWATDADKSSYELTVKQLAKDLAFLREKSAPVVWVTPTTVNTKALPSEEKRTQMSEAKIQEIRQMHVDLGINAAATFVLDGAALTKDQVDKSFDGMHYPPQVYDAGAQIIANALDWLLPIQGRVQPVNSSFNPKPGSMANPALGLMVLCCFLVGLLFFDGYLGFSYLASVFMQPKTTPLPNRITLFYSSKEEQNRYSFVPQDLYDEICRTYEKPKQRSDNIPKSELPSSRRDTKSTSSKSTTATTTGRSSRRDDFSAASMASQRTFGLATINEDSHTNVS